MEKFNILASVQKLIERYEELLPIFTKYLSEQKLNSEDRNFLMNDLSIVLLNDVYTLDIATLFSPILLDLLSRASDVTRDDPITKHEWLCICLSKLIFYFQDIVRFAKLYFEKSYSFFCRFEDGNEPPSKKFKSDMIVAPVYKLLKAANLFLIFDKQAFQDLCDWSILASFLNDRDTFVRWFAYQCLAHVANIRNIPDLMKKKFTKEEYLLCAAEEAECQMWNYNQYRPFRITNIPEIPHLKLQNIDISKEIVNVEGVLLNRNISSLGYVSMDKYVYVPSVHKYLNRLALAVSAGEPVLLQGPVGCGKTSIIEHLAALTGRKPYEELLKVQLGDHMDSKMLLGTHCCTEVPGEFIWKSGILIQAMTEGHWLLLEDIDCAPMDVISLLVPVIQSGTIVLPGHANPIKAAAGFQLFATQRLVKGFEGSYAEFRSHTQIIEKQFRKILMDPFSREELRRVIISKWPRMERVCDKILDVYSLFSTDLNNDKNNVGEAANEPFNLYCHHGRLVSTRDLFKFCGRIAGKFESKKDVSETVFLNALECFCDSIPEMGTRLSAAESIGVKFNISNSKAQFHCQKSKPTIQKTKNEITIGRVSFPRPLDVLKMGREQQSVFAHTRHSSSLLEKIAVAVAKKEPVLLVGETGTGKTSAIQYLSELTKHKLTVINMSQQSDSVDLIGGYKPVDLLYAVRPYKDKFLELFPQQTVVNVDKNNKFMQHISNTFHKKKYEFVAELMLHAQGKILHLLMEKDNKSAAHLEQISEWKILGEQLKSLKHQIKKSKNTLVFKFIEGALVRAMKKGDWLLLDEINLAEAETLECLSGILEKDDNTLFLHEKGSKETVTRHPDFRIFACMNPATDVGKKDLPIGIRNRFTEFFVDEIEEKLDLCILVREYLKSLSLNVAVIDDIVEFYLYIKKIASEKLCDGTGSYPHYSLRTLCRALKYASKNPCHNVPRSLYEAFCLSFLSQLDTASHPLVTSAIASKILGKNKLSVLKQSIPEPGSGKYIPIQGYWIHSGNQEPSVAENYIFTPTVRQNLQDLARIVSAGRFPVLLQGETSVGKTSLIQWLAKASGNICVRVNNHEHTDIQEYIGTYSADATGKLVFKEGILAEAMRNGYWIILDELNLAPTEVMEALNRVLDDNRELFIPETQTLIKAHPGFMIFATQNPPGLYGGRKLLSRAFKNRFIELHFNEIPPPELETILQQRCKLPMSYSKKLVAVMCDLQMRRRESGVFCGKQGFITLRDLFRWGERYEKMQEPAGGLDWLQHLADEGYLLLAGRVRHPDEEEVICEVLQKHFNRKVDPEILFDLSDETPLATRDILKKALSFRLSEKFKNVVWTHNMRRLLVLVGKAIQYKEPVLLIGTTGSGKTTVCQIYAELFGKSLYSVNCHMHSESADFLGGLRPVRDPEQRESKLFEWVDGPLIQAMQEGNFFLADEISLADDSVLERLNSVLEPEQKLLLAERSFDDSDQPEITAKGGFHFLATMNPGGDYGKKELSPALRNRFTEIWCPSSMNNFSDIIAIVEHNINNKLIFDQCAGNTTGFGHAIADFLNFFFSTDIGQRMTLSIRDVLTWVEFVNLSQAFKSRERMPLFEAYIHGAFLAFLDGLGSGSSSSGSEDYILQRKKHCLDYLLGQKSNVKLNYIELMIPELYDEQFEKFDFQTYNSSKTQFGFGPFVIDCGPSMEAEPNWASNYVLEAKTPKANLLKILRAMQLPKPILLEGSPGVGKSSLITILAKASGYNIVRINLSEQTDITDLFGADLPVDGGEKGEFAWRDGPIIQALKKGDWILLDELNLASQSVLEGLNACLDHRNEIYIPELGRTFHLDKNVSRIFCCQNPQRQGGSRKGLPQSFLNRFTQVYMKQMEPFDLEYIASTVYPAIPPHLISAMVYFNNDLSMQMSGKRSYGHSGSPWEFNLRDIFRWCDIMIANQNDSEYNIGEYIKLIYMDRMRSRCDKEKVFRVYDRIMRRYGLNNSQSIKNRALNLNVHEQCVQLGYSFLPRKGANLGGNRITCISPYQLPYLESLMKCIEMNWMAILVGPSGSGKSTLVRSLAEICGQELHILSVNSEMDTIELLGGFEQADINRKIEFIAQDLLPVIEKAVLRCVLVEDSDKKLQEVLYRQHVMRQCIFSGLALEDGNCIRKLKCLKEVIKTLDSFKLEDTSSVLMSCRKSVEDLIKKSRSKESYGGKFEWVDSVLVTAVKKGHWLLIDDANFCSSSVLDRLNALLEPGGVLTINEQGIVDGELRTIVPHPDFRIILTLNPRNGEISRAMRNRGIEIYIEPIRNEAIPDSDVFNLALFAQCRGLVHDKLLLHFCSLYAKLSACPDIETPCVSDFISATSLCVQMVQKHGVLAKAFEDSCMSVFAENNLNANARQLAMHVIRTEVERVASDVTKTDYSIPISELIPTSFDYYQNIHLAMMKKQACLYTVYFKGFIGRGADCPPFPEDKDTPSVFICRKPPTFSFIQPTCFRNDARRFSVVMRIVFESCSIECFEYLSYFIHKNVGSFIQNFKYTDNNMKNLLAMLGKYQVSLKQVSESSLMTNLSETLKYLFKEAEFSDINSFEAPYDLRWNPSLYQKLMSLLRQKHEDAESIEFEFVSRANRCTLLLLINSLTFANELMPNIPNSKNLSMCADEVIKNPAMYRNSPLLPLVNFPRFIETLTASIVKFIQDESMPCSDEYFLKLFEIINSFFTFQRIYLMHAEKGMESTLQYLSFHFSWLLRKLHNLYGESFSMPSALAKVVEDTEVLLKCNVPTQKLRKKCMKWLGTPPIFPDDRAAEISRCAVELYETLDIVNRIKSPRTRVQDFKTIIANRDLWFVKLAHVTFTSIYGMEYKNALTDVGEIRIQMSDTGIISTDDDDEIMQVAQTPAKLPTMSDLELVMDVQLLPLWDYLFVTYEAELICSACILSETSSRDKALSLTTNWTQMFAQWGCRILGLNPVHLAHISYLQDCKFKKSLAPSLLYFMRHLRHGFSSDGLLSLDFDVKDGVSQFLPRINKHWNNEYSWSKQQPLLTHIFSSLFGNEDSPMICRFPLGMYSERIQQLKKAQGIVWKHFDRLANVKKNAFRRNSALTVVSWFNSLLYSITSLENMKVDSLNKNDAINLFEKLKVMPLVLTKGGENILILTMDAVAELQTKIDEGLGDSNLQWYTGKTYVLVGLLTSVLLMPRDYADPGVKTKAKYMAMKETMQSIIVELDMRKWVHDLTCGETFYLDFMMPDHPLIGGLREFITEYKNKLSKMERKVPFRTNDHLFLTLRDKLAHYLETLGSPDEILDIVCKLSLVNDPKEENELSQHNLELITRRALQYSQHLQNFADGILRDYALYPDVVVPFLVGVEQIIFGLSLSCHSIVIKEAVINDPPQKLIHINEFLQQLSQFNPEEWNSSLHMVSSLLNSATIANFKLILSLCKDLFPNRGRLLYRFMKSAILDLINEIKFQSYHPDSKLAELKDLLFSALQYFYKAWHLQDEIKKKKKAEEENLYKEKSMQLEDELSDDEKMDKELKEMFPLYEEEFKDITNPENLLSDDSKKQDTTISDESETTVDDDDDYAMIFRDEDMFEVCQLHATAVSLLSNSSSGLEKNLFVKYDEKLDFLSPFLLRHEVISCIITTLGHRLDASFEKHLIGDQMLLSQKLQSLEGMENDEYYDIYHDPNPTRVVTLKPLLQKLVNHVNILLKEFPENPNLIQILTVTHRVLNFPVSDPLMKFVVGLELILEVSQVWEQNAHSKVSLKDEIEEITRRIIEFRAMELDGWKKGLQNVIKKQFVKSSKWWFFMFPLFYTDNTYADSEKALIVKGLQQCLEDSPIGEFPARLSILHTFLQEFHLQTPTKLNRCYANILFNVYTYYRQFLPSIQNEIAQIRKPIEKELKDFVKIARWNDINFYAVKASVEKSHRFVLKHVKTFEDALKKPAKTVFILPSKKNSPTENPWSLEVEKKHYIYHVPKVRSDIFTERSESFFHKFPFYQKKMVRKTKEIAENFPVVNHINTLNEFCGNIIEALESVTMDGEKSVCTRSREKKQTLLKIQNKRQMLATLFKDLRSIGLSYRQGIVKYMEDKVTELMSMPSFDIMEMKVLKWDSPFKELLLKSSCDTNHYFYKSLAQYAQLQRFMESPCKDLTLDIIQRIRGYGSHLLNLVSSQHYDIVKMSHGIDRFGCFLSMLSTVFVKQEFAYEKNLTIVPPQLYFQESNIDISNLLVIIALAAGQFEALLECAPESHFLPQEMHSPSLDERSLSGIIKGDAAWSQIKKALDVFNCDIKSLLQQLCDLKLNETIVSWDHLRTFSAISQSIQKSMEKLIMQISKVCDPECAMTSNLWSLYNKVCHKCNVSREEEERILDSQMHAEPVKETPQSLAVANLCQKLATQVLLAIQEMVVLSTSSSEDKSESDSLPENLFTVKITGSLLEAKNCLRFDKISKIVRKLKSHISHFQNSTEDLLSNDESFRLLVNLSPLLNQYYQVMKVYLAISVGMHRTSCKFLTILLEVFTILATKGFCIPPELQEEAAKADGTKFEDIESGGFGEGEGTKDVSENIEHEDQLDDANELDQGKKEKEEPKDKDLKDEEQGIEMSNDFEGKLHGGEGAENSDDEDEDEEEEPQDLDKQMGDVEADEAGKLDDKVWGDDSENEEDLREDEESGGVADKAPTELAAKDKQLEDDVEKGGEKENEKGNQPQEPEMDETNEEYTGEKPDPMINAPPTQEPEIEELPENMEITDEVGGDDPGENPEEMDEPTDTLEEPKDEQDTENKENEEADDADGDNKAQDPEGESEDKGQNVTDQHEPNEPTDESNMETEERALPTQTPTTQEQALPSDMKQSSTDPVISEEPMDWENGAQNADEQHKEGLSDAKDMPSDDPGHEGKKTSGMRREAIELQNARKMKQPGEKRTVDESNEEDAVKKCPIMERKDDKILETDQDGGKTAEMYEHVSKEEESSARAVDIATKEQAELRTAQNESQDEEMEDEQEIIQLSSGDEDDEPCNKAVGETLKHGMNQKAGHSDNTPKENADIPEGELIPTQSVARGGESTIHTQNELWKSLSSRNVPQGQVRSATNVNVTMMDKNASISDELWRQHELSVSNLSQELCEQLRLVLEPTKMSKFKGDYRTGKRLNMRKIIPYIASQFRKDKIWLRRTKPSKRQYQIMLAMDDSSSMADNKSKQLAFESLAVLGQSLSLLEAGELSVASFGENVQLLHGFQDQFSATAGARIMEQMTFAQKGTKIAQLLNFATDAMIQARNASSRSTASKETAQLLVIISDGRNIFFEGEKKVVAAVKNARDNNVFMVFLILDNPDGNHSILDIKYPIFEGEDVTMIPYMDKFPFPFYIILRQITALPQVLGEALRQWFELVTSVDR